MINAPRITRCTDIAPAHSSGLRRGGLATGTSSSAFRKTSFLTVEGRARREPFPRFLEKYVGRTKPEALKSDAGRWVASVASGCALSRGVPRSEASFNSSEVVWRFVMVFPLVY